MSSSLEVSKNLKFSYSSRAADGLRMPRMWDRSGGGGGGYESARQRSRDRVSQSFLSLMGMLTLSGLHSRAYSGLFPFFFFLNRSYK